MSSEDTWNALTRDEVLVFFNAMDRHVDLVRATKSKIGGGIWPTCQIYFNNTQSMVIHSPEMNATAFSLLMEDDMLPEGAIVNMVFFSAEATVRINQLVESEVDEIDDEEIQYEVNGIKTIGFTNKGCINFMTQFDENEERSGSFMINADNPGFHDIIKGFKWVDIC